jgi:hypothetical protein
MPHFTKAFIYTLEATIKFHVNLRSCRILLLKNELYTCILRKRLQVRAETTSL